MGQRVVGIIMNGVTGRMGMNQHLIRSILAIREQGGLPIGDGEVIWPEPLLLGRSEAKLAALAAQHGLERWSTDLDAALADPFYEIYFDAQLTSARPAAVGKAIAAGKHVYCEKPVTPDVETALALGRAARDAGVKAGVVQDKLFLPGLLKLQRLVRSGYFGRIIAARGEFGYWVYPGPEPEPQRPSWNYRREDGGGIISDMFAHWRYVLDNVFGPVRSVLATGSIHIPERIGEDGKPYEATAEDAAYAIFEFDGGVVVQLNSSWAVRVNRDELFELQVDGTEGSAVAGLRDCKIQPAAATPKSVWNPDLPDPVAHRDAWIEVPATEPPENGFKLQWEAFLRHVVLDEPFPWDFVEGARGVQLYELAEQSWRERRWIDVPELTL
ncbi:Gfo/Idh/MocA family oxidoreductase [Solirubrobacter sp. CPCC 204708]|uniref:Gfo/Idh/MocA family oxidoreductase n=2 Tax=Solirubrobacter deserti TaxID=2282478 RepID=A0ABT4RJG0_9ACTN|nr:Gfo/Idh/MocA family oxidoreductase [Solirubrobacter deserti]MDA0138647.1 Gfo/Idh/MocA family oxidoreductase [Solirubrobacter deserti]